jgi:AraC-like DNA-binding protein
LSVLDILLIVISSAGLLHGILFAVYLGLIKKKRTLSNVLLGLILIFMAFRIGKSVVLYFVEDLEPVLIFIGLAFLLLTGPLLRWYVIGMTRANFKLTHKYFIELLPFVLFFIMSLFVSREWFESLNKQVIIVFASGLILIYLHLAAYIFISAKEVLKIKKASKGGFQTKSQKSILSWLQTLIIGFCIIWGTYVLNIIDDAVPYILGPIIYSIVIYYLSFKAYKLGATDVDGSVFKENDNLLLFERISTLIVEEDLFLEPNISLSSISKRMGVSNQKTSEAINQCADRNFNDFINFYRIQQAKKLFQEDQAAVYTISSIAYDTGFSSLSAFNSAFKKFEGMTPSAYRKQL